MADQEVKFKLDLDSAKFLAEALKAQNSIKSLGSEENLSGLLEGITHVGIALGTVGAAIFAVKGALDLSMEAESIKQINAQFETLTATAGISATTLKEGLADAAKGLIDDTDLLEIANKAIVNMGKSAEKLPELMELAQKSTAVFGGELKNNFENLTTAISTGNTKMLKHMGIVVDTQKAVENYAKANGLAMNEISEAGKRQAILNEVLAKGQDQFRDINPNIESTKNTIAALIVTVNEIKEIFILAFEKTAGPQIREFLNNLKGWAGEVKTHMNAMFGEGHEAVQDRIKLTEDKLLDLKGKLVDLEFTGQGIWDKVFGPTVEEQIKNIKNEIVATEAELNGLREQAKPGEEKKEASKGSEEDNVRRQQRLENEKKLQEELLNQEKQYLDDKAKLVQSEGDIEDNISNRLANAYAIHNLQMEQIDQERDLNVDQRKLKREQAEETFQARMRAMELETGELRSKLLDQYVKNSSSAFAGIARAFQVNSIKQKAELNDFGKRGQSMFNSFKKNSEDAFTSFGAALVKGADVGGAALNLLKKVLLGTLADEAISRGSIMFLSGIWPPNPVALAGGAALMTLGGALKALSGGGGEVQPVSSPGAAGAPSPVTEPLRGDETSFDTKKDERVQRAVNINIAGNLYDTDSSRRQIMEMMRQETDATDFRYSRIGV